MNRREFIKFSTAAFVLPSAAFGISQNHPQLPMGMNLAGIADWESSFPFRNLMWGARLWMARNVHVDGKFDTGVIDRTPLDENGYPLELPFNVTGIEQPQTVFTLLPNVRPRPPGRYVLLYDGDGDFAGVMSTKIIDKSPGRVLLEMQLQGDCINCHLYN